MKTIRFGILALLLAVCAVSQTPSAPPIPDRERLAGAWHLASIAGPDGKPVTTGVPIGMPIYTRDGHMSVQLMYPKHGDPSRTGVEYRRPSCRQGLAARLPVQRGRALGYQAGPAGRTLVSYMGALLTNAA